MVEPDSGPDSPHVPKLPPGWIAQWDSSSRKYYYVQISTGKSTWDKPTSAAPGVVVASNSSTPAQGTPYSPPPANNMSGEGEGTRGFGDGGSTDRGLGSTAFNLLSGSGGKKQDGGGGLVGQLASGLLGGGSSKPHSGGSSGGGGLVGQIASGLLGGGSKPSDHGGSGQSSSSQHGGGAGGLIGGLVGGIMGHGHHNQQQNFGYSHTGSSGPYTGEAPPAEYKPAGYGGGSKPTYNQPQQSSYDQKPTQPQQSHDTPSYNQPSHSPYPQQTTPSYNQQSQNPYNQPSQNPYGQQPGQYGQQQGYGQSQPSYGGGQYGGGPPSQAQGPPPGQYGQQSPYAPQGYHQPPPGTFEMGHHNYTPPHQGGGNHGGPAPGGYPGAHAHSQQHHQQQPGW